MRDKIRIEIVEIRVISKREFEIIWERERVTDDTCYDCKLSH